MSGTTITNVTAREVYNGIFIPTVEVTVTVGDVEGTSTAPMGQSTGSLEAAEVRDGGARFGGAGCRQAVKNVETELRDLLIGMDVTQQRKIDRAMCQLDGTTNKRRLGANAIVAASAAVTVAAAKALHMPVYRYINGNARVIPVPMMDYISGGHYSYGASSEIQEFSYIPVGADSLAEAMELSRTVYFTLLDLVTERFGALAQSVNTSGGFSLPLRTCRESFELLMQALEKSGLTDRFCLGMDCAASHWFDRKTGLYQFEGKARSREEMLDYYKKLIRDFPIITIEDPYDENDTAGFVMATKELGIQVVGDDFFVTNPVVMREKMPTGAANALLWKYNQIGTLTEAYDAADLAYRHGYHVMTSERSGETEDTLLADLTVAINAGQYKSGACFRAEHTAKFNRLLKIEQELGAEAGYAGRQFREPLCRF